ncbi:PREDICTED: dynein assembly factor 5, axonemal-like, partial [Calidris pugnax]
LVKRLDDASCDVRLAAAGALAAWFQCLRDSPLRPSMETQVEYLYQELLIHLDDPDEDTQKAVLEVLKEGSVLYPEVLVRAVEGAALKHRTPAYCHQLLRHVRAGQEPAP